MAISHAFSNAIPDGTNTNIVRPIDWNSAHNFQQDIAGNTAGVSSVSGTNIVWAGGNNVTLSANGQTISVIAGTAAPSPVNVSAGTASGDLGTVVFSNSNGVSFGLNGSTITATVATNYQSQGAYLTTAALSNHSHGNPTLNLTNLSGTTASNSAGFTLSLSAVNALTTARASNDAVGLATAQSNVTWTVNSAGLSLDARGYAGTATTFAGANLSGSMTVNSAGVNLSLSAGNYLTTAALSNHSHGNPTLALTNLSGTTASNSAGLTLSLSAAAPGAGGAVNFSAGTTSGNLDSVVFSNSNGVSFGLNGSTITASAAGGAAGAPMSYYENIPNFTNVNQIFQGNSSTYVAPFILPNDVSASYLRFFVQMQTNTTSVATTANVTFSYQQCSTWNAVVYKQMTGASSLSLESVAAGSVGWTYQASLQANANGSQYTVTNNITYPARGGTAAYTSSYASTQTHFAFSSQLWTMFTANRFIDVPFETSLPASNYWMAVGAWQSVTTGGIAGASDARPSVANIWAQSNQNSNWGNFGTAFSNTIQLKPGLGVVTTNTVSRFDSIAFSQITSLGGHAIPFFQMIRQA